MSINRPFRRRDDVRWPRSVGTVVPQVAVPGPLADTSTTDAPGRLVRSVGAGDPARLPPLPAAAAHNPETGRVVGSGGSVTASSPPGEVTVTQLVVTVPLDDSVAGTGGTS